MEPVRYGVIGCGMIAFHKHLPAMKKCGAHLVAACDSSASLAQQAIDQFGVPGAKAYTDWEALLRDDAVEAVLILTPNFLHERMTVAALRAGKHVLCEKPMAISAQEAQNMLRARDDSGKLLTIGCQYRFMPASRYIKQEVDAGALGDIYYAKARALRRRLVPTWGDFFNKETQGGGAVIDFATHVLDLTLYLMNNYRPALVMASTYNAFGHAKDAGNRWGSWNDRPYEVEDAAFAMVRMENGATMYLECSWALNTLEVGDTQVQLCGTLGGADTFDGLRINGVKHNTQYVLRPDLKGTGDVPFAPVFTEDDLAARNFLRAIRGEEDLCVLPEQTACVAALTEAIYQSAASGRPVELLK